MPVTVQKFAIDGPLLVTPKKFADTRGFFSETYSAADLESHGLRLDFVQDNHSLSVQRGTVRGLHFQSPPHAQAKLIRVVRGAVLDIAVDLRRGSPAFGQHLSCELSAENWAQLFLPAGFAHGFCTLEPNTEVVYKATASYAPKSDAGILWSDPALRIVWPSFAGTQVSDKDRALPRLGEIQSPFTFGAC